MPDINITEVIIGGSALAVNTSEPGRASTLITTEVNGNKLIGDIGYKQELVLGGIPLSTSVFFSLGEDPSVETNMTYYALNVIKKDKGLVLWLRMDDIDGGGHPIDLGSAGNIWTAEGGASQIDDGIIDKAFNFDGVDGKFSAVSPQGLPVGKEARTITAWVRTNVQAGVIFSYGGIGAGELMNFSISNTQPGAGELLLFCNAGNNRGTKNVADGNWHLVGFSYDPADGTDVVDTKIWLDGVQEVISANNTQEMFTKMDTLDVGSGELIVIFFDGDIDEIRVYNRALSTKDWEELYTQTNPGPLTSSSFVFNANRLDAININNDEYYMNIAESNSTLPPSKPITLMGVPMATNANNELFINDSGHSMSDIEEYIEMEIGGTPLKVGRIGDSYYLIVSSLANVP